MHALKSMNVDKVIIVLCAVLITMIKSGHEHYREKRNYIIVDFINNVYPGLSSGTEETN